MRKICLIFLLIPAVVLATQWSSRTLCPGVNTAQEEYAVGIASNGDMYKLRSSRLYLHSYTGNYAWSSTETSCNGLGTIGSATIKPDKKEGYIGDDYDIFPITSSNGINWNRGSAMSQWNRSPNYPLSVSCAWYGPGKCIYVTYAPDWKIFYDTYPYNNPKEITSLGQLNDVTVRPQSGNYAVVGDGRDLFESTGSGGSWSTRQPIPEINTGSDERKPVLGVISQEHENLLLWSAPGSVGGYDIYYSTGNDTSAITPTSFGRVKAMFR